MYLNIRPHIIYDTASAPTFAGMVSLVNAGRLQAGKRSIGYLNAAIWQTAHIWAKDITSGDNHCTAGDCSICCAQGFKATKGWDPVTGFGTVDFPSFYDTFVNMDSSVGIQPPGPDAGTAVLVIVPILGFLVLCSAGYVIYAYYLYPKDDRYAPIPEDAQQSTAQPQQPQSGQQQQQEA